MEKSTHKPFQEFDKISFYVVAHADDWQLFMHPNVYVDLMEPKCKVIFIITTAGDAGMDESYWMAREEGSKSSIRFCLPPISESSEKREVGNRTVHCWSTDKTTSYFLRLPDGNLDGGGFPACNFQSLARLKAGEINRIVAMDNSATYHDWPEFITTLESIISFESKGTSNIWIHYLNPDTAINPDDHADHIATGRAIQNMRMITTLHQLLFMGYNVSATQEHLSSTELFWKAGMFAVYDKAVYDSCGYSTLRENTDTYVRWCCGRSNFLTILPPIDHKT